MDSSLITDPLFLTLKDNFVFIVLIAAWTLPWKAVALWRAVGRREKVWFVVFLIVNTLAVLEIIYIFIITKKSPKQYEDIWQR
jgi:hypothetical protein